MQGSEQAPLISLGLPVYNGERFLEKAIEACLKQTYSDFELIICDNASTDTTQAICEDFASRDARVRYYRNDENLGAAPNFNRSFELSRGKYFKWVAHDDLHHEEYLDACVQAMEANEDFALCQSQVQWIDSEGNFLKEYDPKLHNAESENLRERFRDMVCSMHWCFDVFGLIRRDFLSKTPLIGSYTGSDRNLLAELSLYGKLHRVPRVLFYSRDHDDRSIRAMDSWSRVAWFNPKLVGRISMPYWRLFGEYFASLLRVPIRWRDKLACAPAVVWWMLKCRRFLWADIKFAIKALARRMKGRK